MPEKDLIQDLLPPDLSIEEEFASRGEDEPSDMTNLNQRQTGIAGFVFISTSVNVPHGPRVKYFEKTGKGQKSFSVTIAKVPRVVANSLPERVLHRMEPQVVEWVRLNCEPLLQFWNEGAYWDDDEVTAFKAGLKHLPTR